MKDEKPFVPGDPTPWEFLLVAVCIAFVAMMLLLPSCCAQREIIKYQRDTAYVEKIQVDSIYKRDSVMIRERGDTIYIYKERIRNRYKLIRDTVRLVRVDSETVERVKEVEVEKPLSGLQKAQIGAFPWLVFAVIGLLLWTFRKFIKKLL